MKRIEIIFKPNGEGVLICGAGTFPCLGNPTVIYPTDLTVDPAQPGVKENPHNSIEYSVPMYYAILIWGQRGIYIHKGPADLASNGGPSAGCIHLDSGAMRVYEYVDQKTRVVISYPW